MLAQPVRAEHVPLAPVEASLLDPAEAFPLDPVADFRPGPAVEGPQGQVEVCRLVQVVDYLLDQAAAYRQVQGAENLQVLKGVYPQAPAGAAQLAPARTTISGTVLTLTASNLAA